MIGTTMFERIAGNWAEHSAAMGSIFRMPEIGSEIPLAEFYEGV